MRKLLILPFIAFIFVGCSHISKINPFGKKESKEEKKEETVVIGGIKYKKIPVRDKTGKITGYRYVREGQKTVTQKPLKKFSRREVKTTVPYYKRHSMVFEKKEKREVKRLKIGIRKKVVFLSFTDKTGREKEGWGKIIPQKIEEILESTGKIRAVDEEEIASTLKVKSKKELIKPENLIKIGEFFSVQAVIDGEVTGIYISKHREGSFESPASSIALARIEVKIYDTLSGTLLKSFTVTNSFFMTEETGKFSDEKAKLKAVELVAKKASKEIIKEIDPLPWWSRVTGVNGKEIYINSGKLTGLTIGQVLSIRGKGSKIVDPLTNKILGTQFGSVKAKVRVVDYLGVDGCICKIISGDNISPNDIVTTN